MCLPTAVGRHTRAYYWRPPARRAQPKRGHKMAQQKTHYHRRNRALCWRAGGQYTTRPSAVTCWRCRRALGEVHGRVARAGG